MALNAATNGCGGQLKSLILLYLSQFLVIALRLGALEFVNWVDYLREATFCSKDFTTGIR